MTKHPRCRGRHRCSTTHNSSTLDATTWEFCTWGQPGIHNKSGCALSEWSLRALGHHKTLLATVSFGKTKSLRMVWCTHQGQLLWGFCFLSCLRLTSPSSRGHMLPTDFFSNVYTSQIWIFIWRAGTKILFSLGHHQLQFPYWSCTWSDFKPMLELDNDLPCGAPAYQLRKSKLYF